MLSINQLTDRKKSFTLEEGVQNNLSKTYVETPPRSKKGDGNSDSNSTNSEPSNVKVGYKQ